MSLAKNLYLAFGLMTFAGIFFCIGFTLFLAYTKLDSVLEAMSKSTYGIKRSTWQKGPMGRCLHVAEIGGLILFPASSIKAGSITAKELERIPKAFIGQIKRLAWAQAGSIISLVVFVLLDKLGWIT
jgi:hypothetical protein